MEGERADFQSPTEAASLHEPATEPSVSNEQVERAALLLQQARFQLQLGSCLLV